MQESFFKKSFDKFSLSKKTIEEFSYDPKKTDEEIKRGENLRIQEQLLRIYTKKFT